MVEGSGVQSEEDRGSDAWAKHDKERKRLTSEGDMRRNVFI
jgi:hypothetical protein